MAIANPIFDYIYLLSKVRINEKPPVLKNRLRVDRIPIQAALTRHRIQRP